MASMTSYCVKFVFCFFFFSKEQNASLVLYRTVGTSGFRVTNPGRWKGGNRGGERTGMASQPGEGGLRPPRLR